MDRETNKERDTHRLRIDLDSDWKFTQAHVARSTNPYSQLIEQCKISDVSRKESIKKTKKKPNQNASFMYIFVLNDIK